MPLLAAPSYASAQPFSRPGDRQAAGIPEIDTVAFDPDTFTCTVLATTPSDVVCGITFDRDAWPNPCNYVPGQSYRWDRTITATDLYIRRFQCLDASLQNTNARFKAAFSDPGHRQGEPYFYVVGLLNRPGTEYYLNWKKGNFTPVTRSSTADGGAIQDYFSGNQSARQVMLTFDAHDTPFTTAERVRAVLDILKSKNVRGTFFVTGQWAYVYGDLTRRIVADGHTLASHAADHASLRQLASNGDPRLARQAIEDQLIVADRMIREEAGVTTKPYFRAPSVDYNRRVLQIAANLGYAHVNYTLDPGDWKHPYPRAFGPITRDEVWRNIFQSGRLRPGAILLQHLDNPITPAILAAQIDELRARGYATVPLAQGLR